MTDTAQQDDEGIRLAKRVAEIVPCSRAEAERYIAGGWVSVDGAVVEDPATRVTPAQQVALLPGADAGRAARRSPSCCTSRPASTPTAALALLPPDTLRRPTHGQQRFLKRHLAQADAVTPLDAMASGLVVFTQDWRVTRKLVEDGDRIEQEYVAEVSGAIAEDGLARLNAGGVLSAQGQLAERRRGCASPARASSRASIARPVRRGRPDGDRPAPPAHRPRGAVAACRWGSGATWGSSSGFERCRSKARHVAGFSWLAQDASATGLASTGAPPRPLRQRHQAGAGQAVVQELAVLVEEGRQRPGQRCRRRR